MREKDCMCADCVPNPTDVPTLVYQAQEKILDILTIEDAADKERKSLQGRLKRFIANEKVEQTMYAIIKGFGVTNANTSEKELIEETLTDLLRKAKKLVA